VHGPLSQRAFLLHMGLSTRIGALQRAAASPERADAIGKAAARLVDAAGMGREYKVMGVTGKVQDKDKEEDVWPFIAGEVQDIPADAKESLPVGPA
jgi:SAM-dependent MidA family methyltransferase